ncbi:hypothetical protein GOP47_0029402 [Adiantum capillus-veneris]|nr:hypothetical protein GOP47_0029402 [Adiantum capillus-veneris]
MKLTVVSVSATPGAVQKWSQVHAQVFLSFASPFLLRRLSLNSRRALHGAHPHLRRLHSIYACSNRLPPPTNSPPHPQKNDWEDALAIATSLYPVYVTVGGFLAYTNPLAFTWFVSKGPSSYSFSLATIMLAMGLSLSLEDLLRVITKHPFQLFFGCAAQYTIMPLLAAFISKGLGLSTNLSAGLILLGCCPGGTASNVVTLIAGGDVPLSVVMTVCTTLAAVFATPLLTQLLAGAYVPVDAVGLAISTMQVVLAPVVLGAWLQSSFPKLVARIIPFSPLVAVLISSLLASSVFSANVGLLGSIAGSSAFQLVQVAQAVLLLHACGFLLGYLTSAVVRFQERQRRAVSIEVGMQNSSLGVVLATTHFTSPMVAMPAAISAVLMNIMGSSLAVVWSRFGADSANGDQGSS